jgi:hypothetical protein
LGDRIARATTIESTSRDDVARAAFAAKLWLKDAALLRFDDYHWEKRRRRLLDRDRRRRLLDRDRRTGRTPAR